MSNIGYSISWKDFNRFSKILNMGKDTLLVDAVKIMLMVKESEKINAKYAGKE